MGISYKMTEQNDNLNPEEKKKKGYYPQVVRRDTVGLSDLAEKASAGCSLNHFEVEMAVKMIIKQIEKELLESNHVSIDGFGTFSLTAESRKVEDPNEIRAESIFVKKIVFKTSKSMISRLKKAKFERHG